jgi:hypothetical protein
MAAVEFARVRGLPVDLDALPAAGGAPIRLEQARELVELGIVAAAQR